MSRKMLTSLDMVKNEIQNAVVQNLAGAPSSPVKGQFYFNSTDNTLYWYNGTSLGLGCRWSLELPRLWSGGRGGRRSAEHH